MPPDRIHPGTPVFTGKQGALLPGMCYNGIGNATRCRLGTAVEVAILWKDSR